MNDYQNIEKECKELEKSSENRIQKIKNIFDKLNAFQTSIKILKEDLIKFPDSSYNQFTFLDESLKNFTNLIEKNQTMFKNYILKPITNLINTIKMAESDRIKRLNEIKNDLSGEKMKLKLKKKEYFNSQNKNENNKNHKKNKNKNEKDENIIQDPIKLYKDELDKMNEKIDIYNKKYKDINIELNAIFTNSVFVIKEALNHFSSYIKNFAQMLNLLGLEISNKIENSFDSKEIISSLDELKQKNEIRFIKELIDNDSEDEDNNINKNGKLNHLNIIESFNIEGEKIEDQEYIEEIINKLIKSKEELNQKEIDNLLNKLKPKVKNSKNNYSKIFLYKLLKLSRKDILSVKNRENFLVLSNIINNLCLNDKDNPNTFYKIANISQKILYKKIFIYEMLRKKNKSFHNKSLWEKISWICLIEKLNKYLKDLKDKMHKKDDKKDKKDKNKNKDGEKKEEKEKKEDKEKEKKEKEKEKKEKDNLKSFLKKKNLYALIKDYGKLIKSQNQIKEINLFVKGEVFKILSTLINLMLCFRVNNDFIEDIIEEYHKELNLKEDEIKYLYNLSKINEIIKYKKIDKESKIILAISYAGKYLQFNEFQKLIVLNKSIYKKIKQKVFVYFNIKIDKNLELWNKWLKIDEIKKRVLYKEIKSGINISIFQGQIAKGTKQLKNMEVIEQDLKRTSFIIENPTHFNSFKSILNCFLLTFPQIGYCQGMNCLVAFLYQLLDQDEEKTFCFLCGIQLNTNYHEIFEDDFATLTIFFKVFEYILLIKKPHIYYKFKQHSILPNCYCSSWFITLFTEFISIIKKDNSPLLLVFIFNKFIVGNWICIFNFGYMLIELCDQKINEMKFDQLISYMMNIFDEEKIFENENYEKCKHIYLKNENIINDDFINKLIDIAKYEYYHK